MAKGDLEKNPEKWQRPVRQPDGTIKYYPVTSRERLFIQNYLRTLDHFKACKAAGYGSKDDYGFDTLGRTILGRPYIREIIDREHRKVFLSEEDVIGKLKEQAHGDPSDFFRDIVELLPNGELQVVGKEFDWEVFRKKGYLVREITVDQNGKVTVKLYDAQKALELIGKHKRLFTETLDINQTGEVIVKVVKGVSYEEL